MDYLDLEPAGAPLSTIFTYLTFVLNYMQVFSKRDKMDLDGDVPEKEEFSRG